MYISGSKLFLRCPTSRIHCFLSSHWPSFRFLSFMAFFIPSIQFFFDLPRALVCFGVHFNDILGSLMYELKKMWSYLRVNLLGRGPRLIKKEFTGPRSHKGWETLVYRTVQGKSSVSNRNYRFGGLIFSFNTILTSFQRTRVSRDLTFVN